MTCAKSRSVLTEIFRDNLEEILRANHIRKYKLGIVMHRSESSVYEWTSGRRTVHLDTVAEIAEALKKFGVSVKPWELLIPGRFAKK